MTSQQQRRGIPAALALVCLAVAAFSAPAYSQDNERVLLLVAEVEVKGSHIDEFIDLQRQYAAARRAAGADSVQFWQVIRGRTNTFHVVSSATDWAEYDEPFESHMDDDDWARWVTRIQATVESRDLIALHAHTQHTIAAPEGSERNLIVLSRITVGVGQNAQMNEWLGETYAPALRNAGVEGVSWAHVVFGANPSTWYQVERLDAWADIDEPAPFADMSDRQRRSLFAGRDEIAVSQDRLILRYRPDLSN